MYRLEEIHKGNPYSENYATLQEAIDAGAAHWYYADADVIGIYDEQDHLIITMQEIMVRIIELYMDDAAGGG